jgi:methionyl-tRNA formyltransferase
LKIFFLGSSAFACPSLDRLARSTHQVLGVLTQPDRPKGRRQRLTPPPIKILALEKNLPVFQPEKVRDPSAAERIRSLRPDILVVVAYGQILPPAVLAIPPRGCVNVHASLLPKYRGAAPIARAILQGDKRTGVSTMFMDAGMDTGPLLLVEETEISSTDTTGTLQERLSHLGASLLLQTLDELAGGTLTPRPQDHAQASYAPKIEKTEARIDWSQPARQLSFLLRAFDPSPGAFTFWNGRALKLYGPSWTDRAITATPGTVVATSPDHLRFATGQGELLVQELQMESRPRMRVREFLQGHPLKAGEVLGG